jgi:predicted nucleic acid-binding Zn ribbon protein
MTGRRWVWRGEEEDRTRPPRRVGEALSEVTSGMGLGNPAAVGELAAGWAEVVGDAVAAHARPRKIRDGILEVEVDSPEWATQLRFLEAQLLDRVTTALPTAGVTGLRLVVRRS